MSQHGGDTVITRDAADSITLVGVQLKSLVSTDFKFVWGGGRSSEKGNAS
jgi:hypothetical protein